MEQTDCSEGSYLPTYLPMKMEQTECCKTSAYKIQMPGNYPEKNIQHGESLKSRLSVTTHLCCITSQKSKDLICTMAKAWYHACYY